MSKVVEDIDKDCALIEKGQEKKLFNRRALPGETRVNSGELVLVPPPVVALGIIGQVASRSPMRKFVGSQG